MKTISLRPVKITPSILLSLAKKGLVKVCAPTRRSKKIKKGSDGVVDTVYETAPRFGTHKLICVGKNAVDIELTSHPDNEDFIIVDTLSNRYKPLYLVIGLHKQKVFEAKAKKGFLSAKDIVALELEYNSAASVFTLCKDTPHCEVTRPGPGRCPVFFVAEPSRFAMSYLKVHGYKFEIK